MDRRTLSAYVAEDRRHAVTAGSPPAARSHGAVLFADISGFTPLTSSLAETLGPRRGAEVLTSYLNEVYDALIAQVHRYRGSVIDFSGDAISCWFDDDQPAADGAHRAVAAAFELQRVMAEGNRQTRADGSRTSLSLKVAVARGRCTRVVVGDPTIRLVDVLAGPAVEHTARCEQVAGQGEVVVDAATRLALGDELVVTDRRPLSGGGEAFVIAGCSTAIDPAPWPTWVEPPADAEHWLDHRLRDRAEDEVTELRPAVALFIRFGRFEFEGDDASDRLDELVRLVQAVLDSYDANLVQVTIGDKGNYFYAAFGAPRAHEDMADRATAAALDLRDVLSARAGGAPGIGIDQGVARVGAYGAAGRRTYGVLGDATNTAARLMAAAAPGEILVTAAVRAATRERLLFDELAPLAVKGREEPVSVCRLTGRPIGTAHRSFGGLVGRADELARLVRLVSVLEQGPGGTVVVEGEPGVGKSHVVEVGRQLVTERLDVTWLTVGADGARRGSLQAFLPALRDLFYQDLAADEATRHDLFDLGVDSRLMELRAISQPAADALADEVDRDRSYLAAVLGLRRPGSPFEFHQPATRFERGLRAIDTFLRAGSMIRPLVVHVCDAHLLDDDSMTVVGHLVESARSASMCVVLDRRPTDVGPQPGAEHTVVLGPLDQVGARELIQHLLGSTPTSELIDHVLGRTGGNALFVEQLVLDLARRGAIVHHGGVADVRDIGVGDVPVTLDAVLVSRLDHLEPGLRRAVHAAAVLGPRFDGTVLGSLLRASGAGTEIASVLDAGEAAGIWIVGDGERVTFRHTLLRDAAYQMQLDGHRRAFHRRAAEVMRGDGSSAEQAGAIAGHLGSAGLPRRAAAASRRAARRYAAIGRLRDAGEHYDTAIEQVGLTGRAHSCLIGLYDEAAEAAAAAGDHAGAIASLAAAIAAAQGAGRRVAATWHARLADSLQRLGRAPESEAAYEAAIVALQDDPDPSVASHIYAGLAMVHLGNGELDEAFDLAELAVSFAAGHPDDEVRALHHLGVVQYRQGRLDEAMAHASAALAVCDRIGDTRRRAAISNTIGLVHAARGEHGLATDAFAAAVDGFERTGNEHGLAGALDNLAQVRREAGAEAEAFAHLERAVEILSRIGMGPDGVVMAMWQSGSW